MILPYGPSPYISFLVYELGIYVLFIACLSHAIRRGGVNVSYLLGAVLFGLLLEYINVNAGINYSYGQFLFMIGSPPATDEIPTNIPLCIGVGWGIIIYTAMLFSNNLGIPVWARPAVDALLALNIDISMDAVAYRLNMWHWGWEFFDGSPDSLTSEWFGVPYANFYGWLLIVFFYSLFSRLFVGWQSKIRGMHWLTLPLSTLTAIFLAQIILFVGIAILPDFVLPHEGVFYPANVSPYVPLIVIIIVVLITLLTFSIIKQSGVPHEVDKHPIIWIVPTSFHLYFLFWMFAGEFYLENVWLPVIAIVNSLLGIFIHIATTFKNKGEVIPGAI